MNPILKRILKEVLPLILIVTLTLNIISYFRSLDLNKEVLPVTTFSLIDNTTYKVDRSKPLLVHFWATWCPTCEFEASNIEQLSKKNNIITIAVKEESKDKINQFMQKKGFTFAVVDDKYGVLAKRFNISAYPTTFIYNKNGKPLFSEVGYTSTFGLYLRMLWASY